jgi:hypothetical protein
MKVSDLIKKLQEYPEDATVVLRSKNPRFSNDFNSVEPSEVVMIKGRLMVTDPLTKIEAYECGAMGREDKERVNLISLDGGTSLQVGE